MLHAEIIGAPLTLWLAPTGTPFPDIDAAPGSPWVKLGSNGDVNYDEAGVTVTHDQTIDKIRTAGSLGAVKAFRSAEDLMIEVTLLDLSMAQYAIALNGASVTTVAAGVGTPGTKSIGLSRGEEVTLYALLARGISPEGEAFVAQYQVPYAFELGSPKPVYAKGKPAGLQLQFGALEDPAAASARARFGTLISQTADAL